jgi:hypothetical protein
MEHAFGHDRFFWLAPSDWAMFIAGIALGAVFVLFA